MTENELEQLLKRYMSYREKRNEYPDPTPHEQAMITRRYNKFKQMCVFVGFDYDKVTAVLDRQLGRQL